MHEIITVTTACAVPLRMSQSDMKKDLKKKQIEKQEIGMRFCGQVFSVVTDKYLLNGSV